ncbi:MAG: delta-lactam-biosynthetic de-N-acetylase [Ruminococcaceae bacterium]|nr:delta-lactam-biosynthetic de-N-acetylase [Oscillospiraceae bacterium]
MKNKLKKYILSLTAVSLIVSFSAYAKEGTTADLTDRLPPKVSDKIIDRRSHSSETEDAFGPHAYSWYCKHLKNGAIPPCPPEMDFISEVGGVYLGDPDEKVIYLTFDAGYENGNVKKILDVMKEKDVTGAFFVLENLVKQNKDLIMQMSKDGHLICNHTAKHKDMSTVTDKASFKAELDSLNELCRNDGVECAPFYRPPEGRFTKNNLEWAKELGYTTVFWSFAYADWDNGAQPSAEKAKQKLLDGTHNGMILLLHPTSSTNAEILGDLIDKWKADGYRFGSLTELTRQK